MKMINVIDQIYPSEDGSNQICIFFYSLEKQIHPNAINHVNTTELMDSKRCILFSSLEMSISYYYEGGFSFTLKNGSNLKLYFNPNKKEIQMQYLIRILKDAKKSYLGVSNLYAKFLTQNKQ